MNENVEWVPWYRRNDYKGDLSEEEKRTLDSFHAQNAHPATSVDELPQEAQNYIMRLEIELYDERQQAAAGEAIFMSVVSAFFAYSVYPNTTYVSFISYFLCATLFVLSWIKYRRVWKANASKLFPKEKGAPSRSDHELQYEYEFEFEYIVRHRRKIEDGDDYDDDDDDDECGGPTRKKSLYEPPSNQPYQTDDMYNWEKEK